MKKNKIVLILITMVFLVLGLVGTAYEVSAASKQTGFVNGGKQTIVYSSYNKNSKVVGKINRGEKLTSVSVHSKNWYYIQYKNIKGYVSIGEVILDKTPKSYNGVGKLTSSVISYVSADKRSKVARTIKNGTSVDITGIIGKWYQIKIGNSIEYITNENIKVSATESVSTYNAKGTVQSTTNVIHAPNQHGKVLSTYSAKTSVEIVGKTKNFYKIKFHSTYAYMLNTRIKIEPVSSYSDNSSRLYYELSSLVYKHYDAITVEEELNKTFGASKYKVIDTIDLSKNTYHKMALGKKGNNKKLNKSGFQAFVAVNKANKQLYIAFSGSDIKCNYLLPTKCDLVQVAVKYFSSIPAQAYDAHLYVNYIYDMFPEYRNYKWYLTGHSYGGYLATKVFLDAESNHVLNKISNDSNANDLVHAGAIRKKIQGVYTFNPVTTHISHFANKDQQTLNANGSYNKYVNNLIYDGELVNYNQKLGKKYMIYVGSTKVVKSDKAISELIGTTPIVGQIYKHSLDNMKQFTK